LSDDCSPVASKYNIKDFSSEAVLWRQLSHPNILPFYGIYRLDDAPLNLCLTAPWMENGNAVDFLKQYPETDCINLVSGGRKVISHTDQCGCTGLRHSPRAGASPRPKSEYRSWRSKRGGSHVHSDFVLTNPKFFARPMFSSRPPKGLVWLISVCQVQ
jgi:serine/threonine protein kinase